MPTDVIDTINFIDAETRNAACVIVRAVHANVGLCLSQSEDGDVEVFLPPEAVAVSIRALIKASER